MRREVFAVSFAVVLLAAAGFFSTCWAEVINVPGDQPTIQKGIDAASNGDTVRVAPGTYTENINFNGKLITVTSSGGPGVTTIDGGNAAPVATFNSGETTAAVLSGFTLTNGNSPSAGGGGISINTASPTIFGNVITHNVACFGGVGIAVGSGSPIIQNNTISDNSQSACSGDAGGGIALSGSSAQVLSNLIANNTYRNGNGGGLSISGGSPLIENNTITGNSTQLFGGQGGAMWIYASNAAIVQNLIINNQAGIGGGIWLDANAATTFVNNTIAANTSTQDQGSAVYTLGFGAQFINNLFIGLLRQTAVLCDPTSGPPVFENNDAFSVLANGFDGSCAGQAGVSGNISVQPEFVDAPQDNYRLLAGSPGIDAGLNSAPDLPPTDFDGLPRIVDGSGKKTSIIDMGAYEFQPVTALPASIDFGPRMLGTHSSQTVTLTNHQAGSLSISTITAGGDFSSSSSCPSSLPPGTSCSITVTFTPTVAGPRSATLVVDDDDTNGPRTVSLSGIGQVAPTPVPTPSATPTPGGMVINVPEDFPSIQAGIDAASNGDTVEVLPGTYFENIDFKGKLITVTSTGGSYATAIDGDQQGPVVVFHSGEANGAVLSGFTIINGKAPGLIENGGGIDIINSSPTISGNVIMHNGGCGGGGGIFAGFSSAIIMNNTISNNTQQTGCSGGFGGGGIELSGEGSAQILSNLIEDNSWPGNGGGIELDNAGTPVIENNIIMDNSVGQVFPAAQGGGVFMLADSNPLMLQNLIIDNKADQGGGIYIYGVESSGVIMVNNTIAANTVTQGEGSAVYMSFFGPTSLLVNNMLIGKAAENAVFCDPRDTPAAFQNNDAFSSSATAFDGSCAGQVGLAGNISLQPLFVNAPQDNYRLLAGSPGIDVGVNGAPDLLATDLDGLPRIVDGSGKKTFIIDMGAYEFQPVTALPTSIDFGAQPLGSHSSQKVTLTNHQTSALSVSTITAGGDFSASSSCPSSLAAGASCTITVNFTPTAIGLRIATLTVNDDDTNGPRKVTLTGTGQAAATPTPTPLLTATPTQTATPGGTPTNTPTPTATPTLAPGTPQIASIPAIVQVGSSFDIAGTGFTAGSAVNFFVATSNGPVNKGPLTPSSQTPLLLSVAVPATIPLGQGFVAVQVVNADAGFKASNTAYALLQGAATAGIPTITSINGFPLAATSSDPSYSTNNVETVVSQGTSVELGGTGFDTTDGVAIDLFCACAGGKVGPFFLNPGAPGLTGSRLTLLIPAKGTPNSPPTGPGSFVVSNAGPSKDYGKKSNAVSVPVGARIQVLSVSQSGSTVTVSGGGFSALTVINLFNTQFGGVVKNLGGMEPDGTPRIPLTIVNDTSFTFVVPAGSVPGPSYVQALNPPFVPFSTSGNDPGGSFKLN
jgi:hypothetical protein